MTTTPVCDHYFGNMVDHGIMVVNIQFHGLYHGILSLYDLPKATTPSPVSLGVCRYTVL